MISKRLCLFLLLVCGGSGRDPAFLHAQAPGWQGYRDAGAGPVMAPKLEDSGPVGPCFYLLKTGFLLEGTADGDGSHYEMKTEFGVMKIPVQNVEFVGPTREDVYRYKKGQVDPSDFTRMMNLAEWCLQNGLRKEGIEEYEQTRRIAPNSATADFISKRIESIDEQPAAASPAGTMSGLHVIREEDSDLVRWTNGVPRTVFDAFSKKVQPVLVSRCASAECHGSQSDNQFKINIPRQSGGSTTYKNLKSAVEWIDLEYPAASPLLSALVTSHGGKKPQFNVESPQYENFTEWIQLTAKELPVELNEQLLTRLRKQRNRGMDLDSGISERPDRFETVKTDVLPNRFQETMLAQQNATLKSAEKRPSVPDSFLTSSTPLQGDVAGGETLEKVNYYPTRYVVPMPESPPEPTSESKSRDDRTADEPDPLDPRLFNARYHPRQSS